MSHSIRSRAALCSAAALSILTAPLPAWQTPLPPNRTLLKAPAPAATPRDPLAAAVARARASVVHVFIEVTGEPSFKIERPGSGVVLTPDGLVLTQANLVRQAQGAADKKIVLQLDRETRCGARLVAEDPATGMALLQAETPGRPLAALAVAEPPEPGDPVAVLSFHDGEDYVAFSGVAVFASGGVVLGEGKEARTLERQQLLLTDAAIQRRSHGGALLDRTGALLGLCNADRVSLDVQEPTLQDLKRPSFGVVIPARAVERAFPEAWRKLVMAPRPERSASARAVALAAPAVVAVHAGEGKRPELGNSDPYATRRRPGVGSGVVVDKRGLVLTNRHLVDDASTVTVTLADGTKLPAEVVKSDPGTNSALLRVTLPEGRELTAIAVAQAPAVGDPVLAVGRPEGHTLAISGGVVSARRNHLLQTDAGLGNHTGGGPLIDLMGELVGLSDAGTWDRIDQAFAQQGDEAKIETSLNLTPGIARLSAIYRPELGRELLAEGAATRSAARGTVAAVAERTAGAVLNIYVERKVAAANTDDNPFAPAAAVTAVEGLGSGVIIDPTGLALTNWHVVDSATLPTGEMRKDHAVRASLRSGRVFAAQVLSISREDDLALLQLTLPPGETVDAVELGSSAQVAVGDTAIAIGNPHGRASTVTAGIITAKNRSIRVRGRWAKLPSLLETDAAINGGNSGGPLFDQDARLIGINSAGGKVHEVTGFAIAVDHARQKLQTVLLSAPKLRSAWLGLDVTDRGEDVVVHAVDEAGPAAGAGIATGDLVRSLDGEPVRWSVGFSLAVLRRDQMAPVTLEIERAGKRERKQLRALSAGTHALFRQTSLLTTELDPRQDAELVRQAATALWRRVSGDPEAAPATLPERLLRIDRLLTTGPDLVPGDLLLGAELTEETGGGEAGRVLRFECAGDAARCFQNHAHYDGTRFQVWIWRKSEVKKVELVARRLLP